MRVCLTIPSLAQAGGGTVAVVRHLADHLAELAESVSVMTLEAGRGAPEALPGNGRVQVIRIRAKAILGLRNEVRSLLAAPVGANPANLVVHNFGLWQPFNHAVVSACQDLNIPVVASVSGMLAPWAFRHKAWKKRVGWWLYQRQDLLRSSVLVASAGQELQDIRRRIPGRPVALIPNGVEVPDGGGRRAEGRGPRPDGGERNRAVVFLGRIHPVKGLRNLVEAWNRVRPEGWRCIIAGPDEAGHQQELETLLQSLHLGNVFQFPGLLEDDGKRNLLNEADVFILPSFTENFGLVVAEALAAGVPVIATKGTPWEELAARNCGWWVDMGIEPLAATLRAATLLPDAERQAMGRRGRLLVAEKYAWPRIARDLLRVYQWAAGGGSRPECVV